MIEDVEVVLAVVLGLAIGLAAMPVLRWLRVLSRATQADLAERTPEVSGQLEATIGLLRSAALVVGPYDEVLMSNPRARTLGLVRGSRIVPEELLDLVRQARRSGQGMGSALKGRRELGMPVVELAVRIVALGDGLVLAIADDRSAQVRTDEIKRDFVGNVSHELKTPVGAIRVLAEALEGAYDDPEAVRRFSARLITETDRLSELIAQIIELSRLQSDDPMLQPSVVSVDDVARAAVDQCREQALARSVQLNAAIAPGLTVLGDEHQLTTAVVNLIQNAINYSDLGARVSVTTRRPVDDDDDFVEIAVSDNGIGIAPDEQDRIFERFYRVDYARGRAEGGTGLGLAIVKHTAGAHGGSVNVWSKPGQGSTFTLRLPAYQDER
ncbi:ATP-binding protein [Propionimicrobium sp. PCR01-08-3]|uniref:sensor histidine kinase n=1 Tax=Propionimicrobium sp. PCR01-08-3 TaxID=3052086 RepID=UPI00255D01ED|nr:ATP-binding protein [Propionimicrobium sp. PCR01-08-3]WIY82277.1 ATP-binding protein [Propionimicrobium sp. PCR01-08-3]